MQLQQPDEKNRPSDAIQGAWIALQRVAPQLQEAVELRLKKAGLPDLSVYTVLWSLDRAGGPVRPRDLGLLLFLPRYKVSRLIDVLASDGLVIKQKCPSDLRGHHLILTDEGRALRLRMWAVYGPAMRDVMAGLTDQEADVLARLLNRLADATPRDEDAACSGGEDCAED